MPFRSEAQRRKFYSLYKQGKVSKQEIALWETETDTDKKRLPERVKKNGKSKSR